MEVKEGAIEAIVKKEKQIIELNFKLKDSEEEFKAQIEVLNCEKNVLNDKINKLEQNFESKINYNKITSLEVDINIKLYFYLNIVDKKKIYIVNK